MDETPEELEQIRREAQEIDPYRYRKRGRIMKAVGLGALAAGLVWVVLEMTDQSRNPCERVRDHFCKAAPASATCSMYEAVFKESVEDGSAKMRSNLRSQCETKIRRLKDEEGVSVK